MAKFITAMSALFARRVVTVLVAACVAAAFVVILVRLGPPTKLPNIDIDISKLPSIPGLLGENMQDYGRCHPKGHAASLLRWKAAKAKHDKLMEDKFTIAIQTYRRPQGA